MYFIYIKVMMKGKKVHKVRDWKGKKVHKVRYRKGRKCRDRKEERKTNEENGKQY